MHHAILYDLIPLAVFSLAAVLAQPPVNLTMGLTPSHAHVQSVPVLENCLSDDSSQDLMKAVPRPEAVAEELYLRILKHDTMAFGEKFDSLYRLRHTQSAAMCFSWYDECLQKIPEEFLDTIHQVVLLEENPSNPSRDAVLFSVLYRPLLDSYADQRERRQNIIKKCLLHFPYLHKDVSVINALQDLGFWLPLRYIAMTMDADLLKSGYRSLPLTAVEEFWKDLKTEMHRYVRHDEFIITMSAALPVLLEIPAFVKELCEPENLTYSAYFLHHLKQTSEHLFLWHDQRYYKIHLILGKHHGLPTLMQDALNEIEHF